ncbi:MAG: hypothetical protein ACI4V1_03500 [Eubacteriales bacterium]
MLAEIPFRFLSDRQLDIGAVLMHFIVSPTGQPVLTVDVRWDWEHAALPASDRIGQDSILSYYKEGGNCYCITRGRQDMPIACTTYSPDFQRMVCTINEKPFLRPPKSMEDVLRMLPMRQIFQHFQTLFLHASQVAYKGRGILFTAPSGVGKTTQAKLWKQYCGADIVCNDRTLVRKSDGIWYTYGYPVDGSEPVCSSQKHPLNAVVLLEQGNENKVERLRPTKALPHLMGQVVMDCWSREARTAAMALLLALMEDVPIYQLTCTPDERAVEVLKNQLEKGG